jgi:hypothetical protein
VRWGEEERGGGGRREARGQAKETPSLKPKKAKGPAMLLDTIVPLNGTTVGVAMPVSVVFSNPVAPLARADIEQHMKISASVPTTGAWHWFSSTRVDFRPETYWKQGTKVTVDANLTDVPNGNGRYGTHSYHHSFTVGDDNDTMVNAKTHTMKVTHNGAVVKTMPIDAGSATWPSWDGSVALVGEGRQAVGGGLVEGGQGVDAGGGDVGG